MRSDNVRAAPHWITPELVRRVLDFAIPVDQATVPVVTVPTRGVKPKLEIVPATSPDRHARRCEGGEGPEPAPSSFRAPPATAPDTATTVSFKTTDKTGPRIGRYANTLALYEQPEYIRLADIAFVRGIAACDLAHAVGAPIPTVLQANKRLGLPFGKRPPLADKISKEQLLELADESIALPELRCDRLKRERYEKWNAYKRDQRAENRKDDAKYRPYGARKPKQSTPSEVTHRPARQADRSAAPREPAPTSSLPAHPGQPTPESPRPARAQCLPFKPTQGAPRHIAYAEKMAAARTHLQSRGFSVQRHDRDDIIARWKVSGWSGLFSNEQLVALAVHHGLELQP